MPVVDAAALAAKVVVLEAAVASGKAREAALGQRVAEVEADNARLSIEVATLRKRPRLPEPAAALQLLVRALGAHERDLRDSVFELACVPRYLAKRAGDLPPDPAGVLGTFAVTGSVGHDRNRLGRLSRLRRAGAGDAAGLRHRDRGR